MAPTFESYGLSLTVHDQAQMVLDPQHQNVDRTISDYHQRVSGMLPEVRGNSRGMVPSYFAFRSVISMFFEQRKSSLPLFCSREWSYVSIFVMERDSSLCFLKDV